MICQALGHLLGPRSWVLGPGSGAKIQPSFYASWFTQIPRLGTRIADLYNSSNNLQNQSIDVTISASGGNDYDAMRHSALFFEKLKKNNKFENRDKKLASLKNPVHCKKDSLFCSSVLYVLDLLKKVSLIRNSPSLNFNSKKFRNFLDIFLLFFWKLNFLTFCSFIVP